VTADEMAENSAAEGGHGGRRGQFTHQLMKKKQLSMLMKSAAGKSRQAERDEDESPLFSRDEMA
jgi:hypothetical protein